MRRVHARLRTKGRAALSKAMPAMMATEMEKVAGIATLSAALHVLAPPSPSALRTFPTPTPPKPLANTSIVS